MTPEQTFHCDFCGLDFVPDCEVAGCSGCPLSRQCTRIVCPRCGYTMLPEARLVGWLRKLQTKTRALLENPR